MTRTAAANRAQYKYNETHLKRVPLDVQREYYETTLKPAADAAGLPVNAYIKQAIAEKIDRDARKSDRKEGPKEGAEE